MKVGTYLTVEIYTSICCLFSERESCGWDKKTDPYCSLWDTKANPAQHFTQWWLCGVLSEKATFHGCNDFHIYSSDTKTAQT